MTNREWLNNLSDLEFADKFTDEIPCGCCLANKFCSELGKNNEQITCLESYMEWLKQERE